MHDDPRTQETAEEARQSGISLPFVTGENARAIFCGGLGLACVFSGIWLGDAQMRSVLLDSSSIMAMRCFTCLIYLFFLVVVILATRRKDVSLRSFFTKGIMISYVAFLAGIVPVAYMASMGIAPTDVSWLWASLFLTKFIGAPLTIGMVCVFAQLPRRVALRTAAVGMLGTFFIYSLAGRLSAIEELNLTVCGVSVVLLLVAGANVMLGLDSRTVGDEAGSTQGILSKGVIRRPLAQTLTPGMVVLVLLSAVMLGYLRNGYVPDSAVTQDATVGVLFVLLLAMLVWKGMRIEHVFLVALVLSSGSILLDPLLSQVSPVIAPVMKGVGTALFEVIVFVFAVWGARNCTESLLTASVLRFVITLGHLLGSLLVAFCLGVTGSVSATDDAAGMLVVFCYLVFMVVLLKAPDLGVPVTASTVDFSSWNQSSPAVSWGNASPDGKRANGQGEYASDANAPESSATDAARAAGASTLGEAAQPEPQGAATEASTAADAEDSSSSRSPEEEYEYVYWTRPCDVVAETYQLTRREREVVELLAHGYTMANMSEALFISPNTTKMHVRNIYTKLDVHGRQDVINMVELVRQQLAKEVKSGS